MRPGFSEFSYGYAITDTLIHASGLPIKGAPKFPSLFEEGQPNGGYDVNLDLPVFPLFLQFKTSHFLNHGNAREAKMGLLSLPYFRMHLYSSRSSRQHALLLKLDDGKNGVFYVAPAFHLDKDLDTHYLTRGIHLASLWLRPRQIANLPDDKSHSVAFEPSLQRAFLCSSPTELVGPFDFTNCVDHAANQLSMQAGTESGRATLRRIRDTLIESAWELRKAQTSSLNEMIGMIRTRHLIEQISFLARVLGDIQFCVAQNHGEL